MPSSPAFGVPASTTSGRSRRSSLQSLHSDRRSASGAGSRAIATAAVSTRSWRPKRSSSGPGAETAVTRKPDWRRNAAWPPYIRDQAIGDVRMRTTCGPELTAESYIGLPRGLN